MKLSVIISVFWMVFGLSISITAGERESIDVSHKAISYFFEGIQVIPDLNKKPIEVLVDVLRSNNISYVLRKGVDEKSFPRFSDDDKILTSSIPLADFVNKGNSKGWFLVSVSQDGDLNRSTVIIQMPKKVKIPEDDKKGQKSE